MISIGARLRTRLAFWPVLAALLLALAWRPAAAYDVMLDVSGSMAGFANEADWAQAMRRLDAGAERKWIFGDRTRRFRGALQRAPLQDQTTRLGSALQTWLQAASVDDTLLMITDNVAADGGSGDTEQRLFYRLLQADSSLGHIAVVPLRLPFAGEVYHPTNAGVKGNYRGERALAAYVIAKRNHDPNTITRLHRLLTQMDGGDWPYIQIRPFAQAGWGESIRESSIEARGETAGGAEIVTSPDGIAIRRYQVGDPLDFQIGVTVQPGPNFRLREADLDTDLSFDKARFMERASTEAYRITPHKKDLVPGEPARFTLSYEIRGFELLDVDFWTLVDLALEGSSWQSGTIRIWVTVERENVELFGPIERWNYSGAVDALATGNAEIQGQIYRFDELLQGMIPETQLQQKEVWASPVWVQVVYPLQPLLLLIIAAILVLALLLLLGRQLARGTRYVVENEAGNTTEVAPGFAGSVTINSDDGATALTLRNFGLFHLHHATHRLRSPMIASSSRAVAHIETTGDPEEPSARYRFVVSKIRPGKGRQEDDEETPL